MLFDCKLCALRSFCLFHMWKQRVVVEARNDLALSPEAFIQQVWRIFTDSQAGEYRLEEPVSLFTRTGSESRRIEFLNGFSRVLQSVLCLSVFLVPLSAVACLVGNRRLQHWEIGAPKAHFNPMYIKQLPSTKKRTCYVSPAVLNLTDIKSTGLAALCIHTTKTQEPNGIFPTILKLWRFLELNGQCS